MTQLLLQVTLNCNYQIPPLLIPIFVIVVTSIKLQARVDTLHYFPFRMPPATDAQLDGYSKKQLILHMQAVAPRAFLEQHKIAGGKPWEKLT